jgi:hypothetical protein
MLSLWKLRVGAEAYYLAQVASGLNDYYSGRGETAGEWLGAHPQRWDSRARSPVRICGRCWRG